MPCDQLRELEQTWNKCYETANYFEHSGATIAPTAKRTQILLVREYRAKQAASALAMMTHEKECPVCRDSERTMESTL